MRQLIAAAVELDKRGKFPDGSSFGFPAVVFAPAHRCVKWEYDLRELTPNLKVKQSGRLDQPNWWKDADVVIISYANSTGWDDVLLPPNGHFRCFLVDEAHFIKTPKTGLVYLIRATCPYASCFIATGTPIYSRPSGLITQIELLGQLKAFGGADRFRQNFMATYKGFVATYNGAERVKNLDVLHQMLRKYCNLFDSTTISASSSPASVSAPKAPEPKEDTTLAHALNPPKAPPPQKAGEQPELPMQPRHLSLVSPLPAVPSAAPPVAEGTWEESGDPERLEERAAAVAEIAEEFDGEEIEADGALGEESDIPLFDFQEASVKHMTTVAPPGARSYICLLADEQGMGKTRQLIAAACELEKRSQEGESFGLPVVVFAPANLCGKWEDDFRELTPHLKVKQSGRLDQPGWWKAWMW